MPEKKKIAKFTYYGGDGTSDREVSLWKLPNGLYETQVEGYPRMTNSNLEYDDAIGVLHGYQGMAMKDWGHSDIEWLELPESPEREE